jgi:hypothetical protein
VQGKDKRSKAVMNMIVDGDDESQEDGGRTQQGARDLFNDHTCCQGNSHSSTVKTSSPGAASVCRRLLHIAAGPAYTSMLLLLLLALEFVPAAQIAGDQDSSNLQCC